MGKAAGGPIACRMPFYALAQRVLDFAQSHPIPTYEGEPDRMPPEAWWSEHLPYIGAVIGAVWADPARELATPPLGFAPVTDADLYAYGCAVGDELQTEGWPTIAITRLGFAALAEIGTRLAGVNQATVIADFLPAQAAPSTGSL
jgi:hypothetical protein